LIGASRAARQLPAARLVKEAALPIASALVLAQNDTAACCERQLQQSFCASHDYQHACQA